MVKSFLYLVPKTSGDIKNKYLVPKASKDIKNQNRTNAMHFDENPFTCQRDKEDKKA